jgi:hypothetical protein
VSGSGNTSSGGGTSGGGGGGSFSWIDLFMLLLLGLGGTRYFGSVPRYQPCSEIASPL